MLPGDDAAVAGHQAAARRQRQVRALPDGQRQLARPAGGRKAEAAGLQRGAVPLVLANLALLVASLLLLARAPLAAAPVQVLQPGVVVVLGVWWG